MIKALLGSVGGFLAPYKLLLIAGAVFAALVTIGGSYYWMYSRGAKVERAICRAELASKDLAIATASEVARRTQKAKDDAALQTVSDMLDEAERRRAAAAARPFTGPACTATKEDADAINGDN